MLDQDLADLVPDLRQDGRLVQPLGEGFGGLEGVEGMAWTVETELSQAAVVQRQGLGPLEAQPLSDDGRPERQDGCAVDGEPVTSRPCCSAGHTQSD